MSDDEAWMREALAEADLAVSHGDVPVGSVIVDSTGTIVGRGHNRREIDGDPTAHAEVVAIRQAAARRGHWRLDDCALYATLEPCVMCAGALVNARLARVVFGAADPKAGAIVTLFGIGTDRRLNHRFGVTADVLGDASSERLRRFFAALRAAGER